MIGGFRGVRVVFCTTKVTKRHEGVMKQGEEHDDFTDDRLGFSWNQLEFSLVPIKIMDELDKKTFVLFVVNKNPEYFFREPVLRPNNTA